MTRTFAKFACSITALGFSSIAHAGDVGVSADWILLGDVAPVHGVAAEKPIAASPLPGQRLPLAAEFIEMQAKAAGFPVDLPEGETIWVVRETTTPAEMREAFNAPPPEASAMPQARDGLVPVLNTDVRRGDPITPDMISFDTPDPKRRIQGMISSPSHLEDTEATRTIRAGTPLSVRDIKAVSVIHKGDPIQLIFENGALRLTVDAKALESGARGETIRVQNLQSNRTMDAIAYAPGEARLGKAGL
jgi:flagella basal body P-ring formation protein FlgA